MARSPTVEILIRDEVSAALERERKRVQAAAGNHELFAGLQAGFAGLESSIKSLAQTVSRDFGTILRLTGASGFLGGGLVAGIDKAMQAVSGLTRAAEQNRYLADQIGLTSAQLSNLTARGQALGMSSEQSSAGIVGLAKAMRELELQGRDAPIYKALIEAGGASGGRVGDQLIAAVRGPGGYEAGIHQFSKLMAGMNGDAQRKLSEIFNLGSFAFRDLYTIKDLPSILELAGPQARALNVAMASLNISWDNVKTRLGGAVMPAFERLSETLDKFLQGPGAGLVKQFADWVSTLNIPWDRIAKNLVGAVEGLIAIFAWGKKTVAELDPEIGKPKAWGPILRKMVGAVVPGFVRHLMSFASALAFVGKQKGVVEKITAAISGGGETTKDEKPLLPMPQFKPQRQGRADDDQIPAAAQPASFMSGGSGFYIPGYATEQDDANELTQQIKGTEAQILRLADYVSSQALTTDPTGAGGLAGLAGQIRTGTIGRGGGGGGGRRDGAGGGDERGGGGTGRGPTEPLTTGPVPPGATYSRSDWDNTRIRASVRFNNPGAQWPNRESLAFGSGPNDWRWIAGHNKIAGFPTVVHGLASNIGTFIRVYGGRTIGYAISKWSAGGRSGVPGYNSNAIITPELARDPNFLRELAKAEAGLSRTISDEQIAEAVAMQQAGSSAKYEADHPEFVAKYKGQPAPIMAQPTAPAQPAPIVWSNQAEIDAIKKEEWEREHLQPGGFTPIPGRGNGRINLNVNVRGRTAKVSSDSSGAMSAANVSRDKSDPSGGIEGFSPG